MNNANAITAQQEVADGPALAAKTPAAIRSGPVVPDYELVRRIGGGAYGEVWLARSVATGALRAAKIVWRDTFEDERPFQREFKGIQKFERISRERASQLALFHVGRNEAAGYFYYVMELADPLNAECGMRNAEGADLAMAPQPSTSAVPQCAIGNTQSYVPHTLRAELAQGRLPAGRVLEIGLALAEALDYLHRHGLVHRDVKPSNVIFVNGRPKLADIGLVTDASDKCSIVGTEGYLPPDGPGTPQADVFAFGKVLYEALTGLDRREFPRLPEDLRSWADARLACELNEVVLTAGAPEPHARYPGAGDLLVDLQRLSQGRSVRRLRSWQRCLAAGTKAGFALAGIVALVAMAQFAFRGGAQPEHYPDGRASTNELANVLCDKAILAIRHDTRGDLGTAYADLYRAIEQDPNYIKPYIGLLECRLREPPELLPQTNSESFKQLAAKLKHLAPGLSATATAQAILHYYDWDFPGAERYALQAIKAEPTYELAHTWYGYMLAHWNRPAEARRQLEISRTNNPYKGIIYRCIGHTHYAERDYVRALEWYEKAIDLDGRNPLDFFWKARALSALNDDQGALTAREQGELLYAGDPSAVTNRYERLRQALMRGKQAYWKQAWQDSQSGFSSIYHKAVIQLQLGNTNRALDLLSQSFAANEGRGREGGITSLLFDEYWDNLRDRQVLEELFDKASYSKVMGPRKK